MNNRVRRCGEGAHDGRECGKNPGRGPGLWGTEQARVKKGRRSDDGNVGDNENAIDQDDLARVRVRAYHADAARCAGS